jgi:hypothetical protein
VSEETKSEETKDEPKGLADVEAKDEAPPEPKVQAKPVKKVVVRKTTSGWRPSWYRVGMGDLFIGIALLIAGTVVAMRTPTRWYGAFIVGTIETVHGLYLLSKKKQS